MKKVVLFIVLALCIVQANAQQSALVFHENFEQTIVPDSMVSSQLVTPGSYDWQRNTRLQSNGLACDSCQVKLANTTILSTISFSTAGYDSIILSFDHICKTDLLDMAKIEYSVSGGLVWKALKAQEYLGLGMFNGVFASGSYMAWLPANAGALPTNTWWRTEAFDLSDLVPNEGSVLVRFVLTDAGIPGPNNNKGWYVDNITIKAFVNPIAAPPIIYPILKPEGIVENTGPFEVRAIINDLQGIASAKLFFQVNGGIWDSLPMNLLTGMLYQAFIPAVPDSSFTHYRLVATDSSGSALQSTYPLQGAIAFFVKQDFNIPYVDNFDEHKLWKTYTYSGSAWESGTPNYFMTSSAYSMPNAWDIELDTVYAQNSYSILESPRFKPGNIALCIMKFYVNYHTLSNIDGVSLLYSSNDTVWNTLGMLNDPNGNGWFNTTISSNNNAPGWSGSTGNQWDLTYFMLNSTYFPNGYIRFRFVFTSGITYDQSGFSIDDFSLNLPLGNDVYLELISSPSSCSGAPVYSASMPVVAIIKNVGLHWFNNLDITYKFHGQVVTENVPFTIAPGGSLPYQFMSDVSLNPLIADTIKIWVTLPGDQNQLNDTLVRIFKRPSAPPLVSNAQLPYGNFTVLHAQSPYPVNWYTMPFPFNPVAIGDSLITPLLTSQTIYYVNSIDSNSCITAFAPDTVFIIAPTTVDAGLRRLLMPLDTLNLSDTESVSLFVRNFGSQLITSLIMHYQVNGGPVVSETLNATINPLDSLFFTFAQKADLEFPDVYHFKIWVELPGDVYHLNDTIWHSVDNNLGPYPASNAIFTDGADIGNFKFGPLDNGSVTSSTNNASASNIYTDYTKTVPAVRLTKKLSYPIAVTTIFSGIASNCSVKVFVDWNCDGYLNPFNENVFTAGPGKSVFSGMVTVPANAHARYTLMRVVLVQGVNPILIEPVGAYSTGETEDYLLYIEPEYTQDVSLLAIISPADTTAPLTAVHPKITIENTGPVNLYQVPVAYRINSNPNINYTWTGLLEPDSMVTIEWTSTLTTPSGYTFCAFPLLPGDVNGTNDTLCKPVAITAISPESEGDLHINVYPNPADDYLEVVLSGSTGMKKEISLQNVMGQIIDSKILNENIGKTTLDLSNIPDGIYLLRLTAGKSLFTRKINVVH
jgi:hypothetical protein